VREGFRYWFDAFPDVIVTVKNLIIEDGQLAVEWTFDATRQDEDMGVRPSGRRFQVLTAAHFRIENGFVTRDFSLFGASGLRQLENLASSG
jgi:predicted ester cyclase